MYKRATRKGDVNNHIAKHHRLTNHTIITNYFQRLTLESRLTNLEQTPLNSCQPIPAPNKQLTYDINITNEQNDLRSRKTVRISEQIMTADKYPCIFSR